MENPILAAIYFMLTSFLIIILLMAISKCRNKTNNKIIDKKIEE